MTYTKKQFLEDVKKEAVALKKHATKEELGLLDIFSLYPMSETDCVYGQMTGSCSSDRAHDLISRCCVRLIDNTKFDRYNIRSIKKSINGRVSSSAQLNSSRRHGFIKYLSQMEAYIQLRDAKLKNLIDFLKGNRKDLVL